jgi:TRAP-type C4-dicarboxylate transport system permease large subunit
LPEEARATLLILIETKTRLDDQIAKLNAEINRHAKENELARRLMTIPGIGPLIATSTEAGSLAIVYALFIGLQWLPRAFGLERHGSSLVDGVNSC